jgi:hypothetical protein
MRIDIKLRDTGDIVQLDLDFDDFMQLFVSGKYCPPGQPYAFSIDEIIVPEGKNGSAPKTIKFD